MIPTDLALWLKSYQENPAPSDLYTVQVNSTSELLGRCWELCGTEDYYQEKMGNNEGVVNE